MEPCLLYLSHALSLSFGLLAHSSLLIKSSLRSKEIFFFSICTVITVVQYEIFCFGLCVIKKPHTHADHHHHRTEILMSHHQNIFILEQGIQQIPIIPAIPPPLLPFSHNLLNKFSGRRFLYTEKSSKKEGLKREDVDSKSKSHYFKNTNKNSISIHIIHS